MYTLGGITSHPPLTAFPVEFVEAPVLFERKGIYCACAPPTAARLGYAIRIAPHLGDTLPGCHHTSSVRLKSNATLCAQMRSSGTAAASATKAPACSSSRPPTRWARGSNRY